MTGAPSIPDADVERIVTRLGLRGRVGLGHARAIVHAAVEMLGVGPTEDGRRPLVAWNEPEDDDEREVLARAGAALLLRHACGLDADKEDLADTPDRMARALREMTSGRHQDPAEILARTFDADGYDEIVVVRDIEFTSLCEHHVLPFIGRAHVAYLPGRRVVGLSKIPRLVECFARRLQIQERLTMQIAEAMGRHLEPRGVAVVVEARHECMACRGVRKPGATMVTSSVRGAFRDDAAARAEVLGLLHNGRGGQR